MSIEMQKAIDLDNTVINENGEPSYVELEDSGMEAPVQAAEENVEITPEESEEFDFFAGNSEE